MTRIKHIDGIMWASDILNGQKEFPTFNKKKDGSTNEEAAADFAPIFKAACAAVDAQQAAGAKKTG